MPFLGVRIGVPQIYDGGGAALFVPLPGASIDIDFTTGGKFGVTGAPSSYLTTSRASVAYVNDNQGNWSQVAANQPRISNTGLLVEEARTNPIRNNAAQGAVVGTIGSGGSLPTNWSTFTSLTGTSVAVIGTGVENGIDYVDIRFFGNASGAGTIGIYAEPGGTGSSAVASNGQTWSASCFFKQVGGTTTNINAINILMDAFNGAAYLTTYNYLSTGAAGIPPATAALGASRFGGQVTIANASTTNQQSYPGVVTLAAGVFDITLRIGWIQTELGASVTSPIRTTSSATTRTADTVRLTTAPTFGAAYSMYAQGTPQTPVAFTGAQNLLQVDDGTASQRSVLRRQNADGKLLYVSQGGTGFSINPSTVFAQNTRLKWAAAEAAADQAVYTNGILGGTATAATLPTTPTNVPLGNDSAGGGFWNGFIERIALWPTTRISNLQLLTLVSNTGTNMFMQDGDSLAFTNGSSTGMTFQTAALPTLKPGTAIRNIAVGGNYLSSTVLNFTPNLAVPFYSLSYQKFVVHILAGTNDIRRGDVLAVVYANLQAYVNKVHALGPNAYAVVCSQPLQCDIFGNGPQLTELHALNDMIYANWNVSQAAGGLGADGLIDYFAEPTVGMNTYSGSAFCSGTWSADGQHLVDAGKLLMGPLQSAVINAITTSSTLPKPGITVPSGLIGYWPLDTIAAADTWGQNNGVATGAPTVVAGQVGNCFNFTGANYVQIPSVSAYNFTAGGYSYAFWINGAAASQPGFGGIISKGEATNDWGLQRDASTTSLVLFHGAIAQDFQTGSFPAVFNSTWNHVAVTYDGTTAILYINSAPFGFTVPIGAPAYNAAFNVRIGAARAAGVPVVAKMDNVKLWNRKLSAAEVLSDYNAGLAGTQ